MHLLNVGGLIGMPKLLGRRVGLGFCIVVPCMIIFRPVSFHEGWCCLMSMVCGNVQVCCTNAIILRCAV